MIQLLGRALEHLTIARQAIDTLNKMDAEQTRMRYCFAEFKEVYPYSLELTIGYQKSDEIMYWDKYLHSGTCKADEH